MELFIHIITHNIVPIFFLIGTGVLLGKIFKLDVGTLSKLSFYALMPFYAFTTIYTNNLSVNMGKTLLFAALFLVLNMTIGYAAAAIRRMNSRKKHILVNTVILYNSGNIGIPLITLIFMNTAYLNQALVIQITIMLTQSFLGATVGFYNAGRSEMHWRDSILYVLKMPAIYAIAAATLLKQVDIDLTLTFVWPAFIYLKQAMIGLVLLTLGIQLSYTKISSRDPDAFIAVALRLAGGPIGAFLIIKLLGISGLMGQVLLISSAAPTAVMAALIAIERNTEPEFASKTVTFTTIICSITLVFVVYFSRILFPI
ncbi:MAG TPA: transporter [Spirochaeta sp.]|nr:transporter [Spirochaeta sp.]